MSLKEPKGTEYHDASCAYCPESVRACRQGESAVRGCDWCRSVDPTVLEAGERV